jgi:DNA invertase Pin-like site-specific DNA recombinase
MYIGYARVSTHEQHLALQQDALTHAGCKKIVVDRVSGTVAERPGLAQIKEILRAGDTLVVWRLDRLGRSIKDLITWVSGLEHEGIGLKSLHEVIDTTSPSGKLTFHIFAALAEFERQLIQERTQAGLGAARARGRVGGRPKALAAGKQQRAVDLYQATQLTVKEICEMMGISKPTLYTYVRQAQASASSTDTKF